MTTFFEQRLLEKGIPLTRARRAIGQVLCESRDHPDVRVVHHRVMAIEPSVSLPTVYRSLKLFEELGLLEKHVFEGASSARYELLSEESHDHLVDVKNNRVLEFKNEEMERLKVKIAKELGYDLIDHRLELYGVPAVESDVDNLKIKKNGK